MSVKIALAGNPNSGKTTMFNALTGSNQYVGNWPGVTVEKKEGKLKGNKDVSITDLPGIYSLSPYTLEEVVSRNYLIHEQPDVILNIVDGTNIERNLYLTTQLTELGIPVVVAVNMMDIVNRRGDKVNCEKLSAALGCEVVEVSALHGKGIKEAAAKAVYLARNQKKTPPKHTFNPVLEETLSKISAMLGNGVSEEQKRFFAVKLFERDGKLSALMTAKPDVENFIVAMEKEMDDDAESIITNERYTYIGKIIGDCFVRKNNAKLTASDRIDKVVTNRWLALPIFAVVMFCVYYVAVTALGTTVTDWANDGVFGDGWHLTGASAYEDAVGDFEFEQAKIEAYVAAAEESNIDVAPVQAALEFDAEAFEDENEAADAEAAAEQEISDFIATATAANLTAQLDIEDEDGGVESTLALSVDDFSKALEAEEPDPAGFGIWIPGIPVLVENLLINLGTADWLNGLVLDGIVGGVGAVLGFVPQMLLLFLMLAFLEDCGYMARVAFIMDRIFRKFGLSGKSFIPMLISSGCGVPGIMASRTIENDRDRKMTIMTTTFIPCGAKLPIVALIAGALFGGAWWVAPSAYFLGVGAVIVSGVMLKKTRPFAGEPAPFVMELPSYHAPKIINILRSMWERGWSFIKKAGTIILISSICIWFLSSFGFVEGAFGMVELGDSMLAVAGRSVAWIFSPLGFGNWQATVATLMGLVAKEEVVGVFGVLFGVAGDALEHVDAGNFGALSPIATVFSTGLSAYSFLVFNLLCAPCFAAIGAIRREMNNFGWTVFAIAYQCVFAYAVSLCVYQFALFFISGVFALETGIALAVLAIFMFLLFRPYKESKTLTKKVRV